VSIFKELNLNLLFPKGVYYKNLKIRETEKPSNDRSSIYELHFLLETQ